MTNMDNNECLICKSKKIKKYNARFAQFIADRISDGKIHDCKLIHCKDCGFAYFDYRFSDDEILKLYKNYRDSTYQKLRQKSESWYSEDINKLLGNNKLIIETSNKYLSNLLQKYNFFNSEINIKKEKAVLDFGGDEGQFIPKILNDFDKYVYDVSEKPVQNGIIALRTIEECKKRKYDLILCSCVLEHVINPDEIIKTIKTLLAKNGILHIELPYDSPFYKNFFDNIQYIFNPHYKLKDILKHFLSTFGKNYYIMHEHINYFTLLSIQILLTNNNFKIISSEIVNMKSETGSNKIISILAKLNNTKI